MERTAGGRRRPASILGLSLVTALLACEPRPDPASIVFVRGTIYRGTDSSPWAEALAVSGDRIVSVGTSPEIAAWIGEGTKVVDLGGRLLLPGFRDAEVDLVAGARSLEQPNLGEARSYEELLSLIRTHARRHPDREWIVGVGYLPEVLGGKASREELDEAVSDRAAVFFSLNGTDAWASTRALELAGLSAESEPSAVAALRSSIPSPTPEEKAALLTKAVSHLHRFGITSVRSMDPLRLSSSELRAIESLKAVQPWKASPEWAAANRRNTTQLKTLSRSGEGLVFGSNWPFGPLDPLVGIAAAVTRQDLEGKPEGGWLPAERLSVEEAVAAYTRNAGPGGTVEVGNLADLAVLSENIFSIPAERIAEVKVEMTVFGGRIVYVSESFDTPGSAR